ncbi:MAG: YceI family protein [Sulfitobacter sp.]
MKQSLVFPAILALLPFQAAAEAVAYKLDPPHSQALFTYDHNGFSTTFGIFSGFEGDILFDSEKPEESSVSVSIPVQSLFTGWEARFEHFMSDAFFNASETDLVTFQSTSIRITGKDQAIITGDLTLNGVTNSVDLDAELNLQGTHRRSGVSWLGFDATTTLLRTDYGLGLAAPSVSDEVEIVISIEAGAAE